MTADIPTLIAQLSEKVDRIPDSDAVTLDKVDVRSVLAALEAQSTELARDVAHREEVERQLSAARNVYPNIREALAERDAARTAIREALAAWHRGMTLGDTQYIVNDQTIDLAMTDIWDALSRDLQEGGN